MLTEQPFADLEIHIFPPESGPATGESAGERAEGKTRYSVRLRLGGELEFPPGHLTVDALSWVSSGDPVADGQRLFDVLFTDPKLREAWAEARGRAPQRRIRLWIDKAAPELHALPWELLHDKGVLLSACADTPFSRYLPNDTPWGDPVQERPIRVLAVISNPDALEAKYKLAQLDVGQERELLETALGGLEGRIQLDFLELPVTLRRLAERLREGYHILHYVGHGTFGHQRQRQAALYLQDEVGNACVVTAENIAGMLKRQTEQDRPRMVFLAACQSAAGSTADAFSGLGQQLVAAGVPAVVAMQDVIAIQTARELSQAFYKQLLEHGLVDRALNEARDALIIDNRPGAAVPVLFMRLKDGRLFAEASLESKILDALCARLNAKPESPEMTLDELCEAIGVSQSDRKKVGEVWYKLSSLKEKEWIEYKSLEDGSGGIAQIRAEGVKVAKGKQQAPADTRTTGEAKTVEPCPPTWGDLVQRNQECARIIQRDKLVQKIKNYFARTPPPKPNYIVLYGQPMAGKTGILHRSSEVLGDDYVPLIVTSQGGASSNLDYFLFDLVSQLTGKFNTWAKRNKIPGHLDCPDWKGFGEGKGETEFYKYWHNLRQAAGSNRQHVVMFDEIECLLDQPEKLDVRIINFLDSFVRYPDNGYFILAGSERIVSSRNEHFSLLIGKGHPIRVRYFNERTVMEFFSAVQHYCSFEGDALKHILALCDGHPRILQNVYEEIASLAATGKRKIERDDIELIATDIIDRTHLALWALSQRLSHHERWVIKLISQKLCAPDDLECYLNELFELVDQPDIDYHSLRKGVADLEEREWIEWRNRNRELFRFRLGVLLLWLRYRCISLDEI